MSASVFEIANLACKPGSGDEFARQLAKGNALIAADPACHGVSTYRGVEDPDSFVLVIGWDSIDDHNRFRDSASMAQFGSFVGDLLAAPPAFSHYNVADDSR